MLRVAKNPQPDMQRFVQTVRGEITPDKPPAFEYIVDYGIVQAITTEVLGREWVPFDDGDRAAQARFFDNCIAFWHAMGYDFVRFEQGIGLKLTEKKAPDPGTQGRTDRVWADLQHGSIATWEDFERYDWPDSREPDIWALEYICSHLPEGMGLITCHSGGIFEHLSRVFSYEGLCLALYDQPDLVEAAARRVGECIERYYAAFLELDGVGMVVQGDDMGHRGGLLVSKEHMQQYCLPWLKRYVEMTHAKGLPYVLHSCGQVLDIMPELIGDVGIDGKHSFEDAIVPVTDFYDRYGSQIAVFGGLDINILSAGTPEEVHTHTRRIIDHCAPTGRYAYGSGNSVPSYVPIENYLAMQLCME